MHGQHQGVISTKVAEPTKDAPTNIPHQKKNDILITEHEVKSLMYADQTGLFPAVSSLGNKYVMILHHVNSYSSWLEAMQNQSGGKLILACAQALARMRHHRLIPKHQILNNQASAEYKATITASGMTYELVPPEEHQCNMAKKAIQTFKDHFIGEPLISGVNFSHRLNGSSSYFVNPERIQTYWRMHMSTNITTTIGIHLSPSAWKHWSMTNPTNAAPTQNTASKLLSWARPPNTINVGNFGPTQHAPRASPGQPFSSTNT
jgi:hypothetical protein